MAISDIKNLMNLYKVDYTSDDKEKRQAYPTGPKADAKVAKVMHEFKTGKLTSSGKQKVKNHKQAIAIALSEARRASKR